TTRESSSSPSKVSLYNPESVLEDLSENPNSTSSPQQFYACLRHSQSRQETASYAETDPETAERTRRQIFWYRRQRRKASPPELSEHHRRYLEDVGALLVLPKSTTDALLPIYTTLLNDLIPILDGGICLVACKSKQAAPFLQVVEDGEVLNSLDFASKLLTGLDAAMKANLEPDRVTKIQILALMHLHNDGIGGVDRSSSYLSQAICEAWSISLHLNVPRSPDRRQGDFLWWALRNFDRLNKPIMGAAPFMIDDTDIALERIALTEGDYRSQLMSVSLALGDLMITATRVYKASSKATVDDCGEFPSLSKLTSNTSFDGFHRSHAAYLEIWYHVAAMLSCRYSGPGSPQYNRRLASAGGVLGIISKEGSERLPPLPLVPYAVSMATTVVYRALRDNQRDTVTTCADLGLCCKALDVLSERWTTVKGVARLAKRLLQFIQRSVYDEQPQCTCLGHASGSLVPTSKGRPCHSALETEIVPVSPNTLVRNVPDQLSGGRSEDTERDALREVQLPTPAGDLWDQGDVSYLQLDRAFYDMFDDGMPDIFRDSTTWDFMHAPEGYYDHPSIE
ncbi:hypothetical protein GCG54_00007023, partial [Colletotrichum gloeosporioides]